VLFSEAKRKATAFFGDRKAKLKAPNSTITQDLIMATIRQYYETDFSYALRVHVQFACRDETIEGALLYDFQARTAFLACYVEEGNEHRDYGFFLEFLRMLQYGRTQLRFAGRVTLPSTHQFYGDLRIKKTDSGPEISYRLYGDPTWRSASAIRMTHRVFIYSQADLEDQEIVRLQREGESLDHELQFRSQSYAEERARNEHPLAFVCHDFRDKDSIARPIAINLQKMLCSVWYDEFSLRVGHNLRESIEKGLKTCKKCILVLSPSFFSNDGWTKREFDSVFTREILEKKQIVLPIWYGVTKQEVYNYSPSLLNVKGLDWDALGEKETCRLLHQAVLHGD